MNKGLLLTDISPFHLAINHQMYTFKSPMILAHIAEYCASTAISIPKIMHIIYELNNCFASRLERRQHLPVRKCFGCLLPQRKCTKENTDHIRKPQQLRRFLPGHVLYCSMCGGKKTQKQNT